MSSFVLFEWNSMYLILRVKEEEEKQFLIPFLGVEVTGSISGRIINVSNRY